MSDEKELPKEIQEELKKKGLHIDPKTREFQDPMKLIMNQLMAKAPKLIDDFFSREKRCTLELKLTYDEVFKLSEFLVKNNIGKTQVMEDP